MGDRLYSETCSRKMSDLRYAVTIEPLSEIDGGGFVATVPDLPGCMSDGATPEKALANIIDAIAVWIEAARRRRPQSAATLQASRRHLTISFNDHNSTDRLRRRAARASCPRLGRRVRRRLARPPREQRGSSPRNAVIIDGGGFVVFARVA